MIEFDSLLKEYRTLAIQVDDERHYLEHLEAQLIETENRLKEIVEKAQQPQTFVMNWELAAANSLRVKQQQPELSALDATVRTVAEMGGSVSAEQLSRKLQ